MEQVEINVALPTKEEAKKASVTVEARYEQKQGLLLELARIKQSLQVVNASIERNELVISDYLDQFAPEDRELERAVLEANQ